MMREIHFISRSSQVTELWLNAVFSYSCSDQCRYVVLVSLVDNKSWSEKGDVYHMNYLHMGPWKMGRCQWQTFSWIFRLFLIGFSNYLEFS